MKRSSLYFLREIAGVPYLLPFGQMIADYRRSIQLNSTGAYLWNLLSAERTAEELLTLCADSYDVSPEELPALKKDVKQFLDTLVSYGVLEDTADGKTSDAPLYAYAEIGGLYLKLSGPPEAFSKQFDAFIIKDEPAPAQHHLAVSIRTDKPLVHKNGNLLLRSAELSVIDIGAWYLLLFPATEQILEVHLAKDASRAVFYCQPPFTGALREALFHAVRMPYLYLAQLCRMAVLHSASLLYRDKAWLFSACSGAGKSTHTGLWHSMLHTPLINGDLNLLAMENGKAVIHGLPWCGTSGISDTKSYPLGGIILLKQAANDYVEELTFDKQRLLTAQRLISPSWTEELQSRNFDFIDSLAPHILICRLHCTMENTAVETIRKRIDRFLAGWSAD